MEQCFLLLSILGACVLCYLAGLELGDLCPELEMEDGEDEEGKAEAQDEALHVLHLQPTLLTSQPGHSDLKQTKFSQFFLIFTLYQSEFIYFFENQHMTIYYVLEPSTYSEAYTNLYYLRKGISS